MLLSIGCTRSLFSFRGIIGSTFTVVSPMRITMLIELSGRDHHNPGIREMAGKRCRPAAQAGASTQRERKRPGSRRKRRPHEPTWAGTASPPCFAKPFSRPAQVSAVPLPIRRGLLPAPPLSGLDPEIAREGKWGGRRVEKTGRRSSGGTVAGVSPGIVRFDLSGSLTIVLPLSQERGRCAPAPMSRSPLLDASGGPIGTTILPCPTLPNWGEGRMTGNLKRIRSI